jgi:ADP-ribose pyrophosphatase YjhB (NUDIX family)
MLYTTLYMRRIAVRGIAVHSKKLLAAKLKPYNDMVTPESTWWCIPGGTVEDCESLESAIAREMFEETGIHPAVGKLLFVQQFGDKEKEHLEFFFHIENADAYTSVDLSRTSHGGVEIEKIDFVDPAHTTVLPSFLTIASIEQQITTSIPVTFHSFLK